MKYLIPLFLFIQLFSCQNNDKVVDEKVEKEKYFDVEKAKEKYNEFSKFSPSEQDTLMTNLTTYIYRKPSAAAWDTKFNPEFRKYYFDNKHNLEMTYLHHSSDSLYYYYLLRDARDQKGMRKRGVGGKFYLNSEMQLSGFEETFNTPTFEDDTLIEIGFTLMEEMVNTGNVTKFLNDKKMILWPDNLLFYSKEKHEWRSVE